MSKEDDKDKEASKMAHVLANKNEDPAENVAQWLEDVHHGTLSTISTVDGLEGYPHGSIVPFAIN